MVGPLSASGMTAALSMGGGGVLHGVGQLRRDEVRRSDEPRERRVLRAEGILRRENRELRVTDLHDAPQRVRDVRRAGVDLGDRRLELKLRGDELSSAAASLSLAASTEL